jgi:hypothetical protein
MKIITSMLPYKVEAEISGQTHDDRVAQMLREAAAYEAECLTDQSRALSQVPPKP